MKIEKTITAVLVTLICACGETKKDDPTLLPAEGGRGSNYNDGASWDYWNKGAHFKWRNLGGDYFDSNLTPQGVAPWSSQSITDTDSIKVIEFDVKELVNAWQNGDLSNRGFFIKYISGGNGPIDFATKESAISGNAPKLVIVKADGSELLLEATGDTFLTSSSQTITFGQDEIMRLRSDLNMLVWFDLSTLKEAQAISAKLILTSVAQFNNSDTTVGIFATRTNSWDSSAPIQGIAAGYLNDEGILNHDDVVLHYNFDSLTPNSGSDFLDGSIDPSHAENIWPCSDYSPTGVAADGSTLMPVKGIPGLPETNAGSSLCTRLKFEAGPPNTQGLGNYGMSLGKTTISMLGEEHVDELFVRVYMFLGATWGENLISQNGKRPGGISGTYSNTAYSGGWGGRKTTGANGWSARGGYSAQVPYGYNPLEGYTSLSTYLYHADQEGEYGDLLIWDKTPNATIQKGKWYCIEQQLRMNTTDGLNILGSSGNNDGVIRGWVDGRLVFEKTDIRFTDMDYIKIQVADFGLYYGGVGNTPYDQHMAIDNIVVARAYIGPMNK